MAEELTKAQEENRRYYALRSLGMTEEEAKQVIADDKKIDKGEKLFELTDEQKKNAKQARNGAKSPTVYKFTQRERKPNVTKGEIITYLAECFKDYDNITITNKERQIAFSANGNDYELTLVQKRKKA